MVELINSDPAVLDALVTCDEGWIYCYDQETEFPIVQTLLPVTFGYSVRIEEMKEAVMKVIDTRSKEDFHGAFQKLLEQYKKCIAAGGDYFEED